MVLVQKIINLYQRPPERAVGEPRGLPADAIVAAVDVDLRGVAQD